MTRNELFWLLLVTGLMLVSSVREAVRQRYAMAAVLAMIPMAGWVAVIFGSN